MSTHSHSRFWRPETLTAIGLAAISSAFLIPTFDLPRISALLPATMLIGMLVLAVIMLVNDQRKASKGEAAAPMTKAPKRVLGALVLIALYAIGVDFIGFYPSSAISIPLVAFVFGYRQPLGLAIATAVVIAAIYLIFSFAMSQEFPTGVIWTLL